MYKIKEIQKLLLNVSAISKKYENLAKITGENFNIFNVLGLSTREVRTHSAFIAELLNPNGSHEQGDEFLKLFIKILGSKFNSFELDSAKALVDVEKGTGLINKDKTEGGNLDIIVSDNNKAIIVENKIYAIDQKSQLIRYYNYGIKNYKDSGCEPRFVLLYLTLYGKNASELSIKLDTTPMKMDECFKKELVHNDKNKDYYILSYEEDIIEWLKSCKEKAVNHPILRETMTQYINLIKQLTGQTMNDDMKNEIVDEVIKDNDSLNAFFEIKNNINEVKYAIFKNIILGVLKSSNFTNATESINNDNEKATINLKNDYQLGVWFAGDLDNLIIGIIHPTNKIVNDNYGQKLINAVETFKMEMQIWNDGLITFRPCEYTRLDVKEPWLKIQNGEFEKFIKNVVEKVKEVQ